MPAEPQPTRILQKPKPRAVKVVDGAGAGRQRPHEASAMPSAVNVTVTVLLYETGMIVSVFLTCPPLRELGAEANAVPTRARMAVWMADRDA